MTILDTDTQTLFEQNHPKVTGRAAVAERTEALHVAVFTRVEWLRGRLDAVLKADTPERILAQQQRLADTEAFLARFVVVPFDSAAGAHLARLTGVKQVRSIGRADLLIACVALAHGATLVTRNTKDFRRIPGLRLENWAD